MANYFVSYDLNGQAPTHAQMDAHLNKLGGPCVHRVLETVWYVKYGGALDQLYAYVNSILSNNDRLLVIDANNAQIRNLLVTNDAVIKCWNG